METAIIAAFIASVTTLAGVFLGHWLAVSRRKERYTDFLYQERFKAYMEFMVILFDMNKNYSEAKWDDKDIKRLDGIWNDVRLFLGKKLLVIPSNVLVSIGDSMKKCDPEKVAKTESRSIDIPLLEVIVEINRDLEIPYFHKEIKSTMEIFTRRNRPENVTAIM